MHAASVVVVERFRDAEQDLLCRSISHIGIRAYRISCNRDISRCVIIKDVEKTIGGIIRMEGETQQTAFAAKKYFCTDIQEVCRIHASVLPQNFDDSVLLYYEQPAVFSVHNLNGRSEACGETRKHHILGLKQGRTQHCERKK